MEHTVRHGCIFANRSATCLTLPPSIFLGRPFASSLESLSACDMNTIHAMADPHLRVELRNHGQYCGPMKRRRDDVRNYFEEYCQTVFPNWTRCKELASALIDAREDQLDANIQTYRRGSHEKPLYDPFEYIANRAFEAARQHIADASRSPDSDVANSSTDAHVMPDISLNLMAVPTYDHAVLGCAADRK